MKKNPVKKRAVAGEAHVFSSITKTQFDVYCYVRMPNLKYIGEETAWFQAYDRKLLATIVRDHTDGDFGFLILGRDKRRAFRLVELCTKFYKTERSATSALKRALKKYENDGKAIYEQGDEKARINEILIPQVADTKLHPYFKILITEDRFEAARHLIAEIAYSYVDVDGNYIKDFQSTGFDARLWELYLYAYFHSETFRISNEYQAPDYFLQYFGETVFVEAVTVNASPDFDQPAPQSTPEVIELTRDYMPIKYGSPLTSKLKKKYWEQPHVRGHPLVLAIHDYHIPASFDTLGSMTWSRNALTDYLYGYRMKITKNPDGTMTQHIIHTDTGIQPVMEKITEHNWKHKTIPSGFFFLPEAENISAVLFSNNATITTFNRMGKLAGLGSADIKMLRHVTMFDPDPFAARPIFKMFDIDDPTYEESWADATFMCHNPTAKHPVDPGLFPSISHVFFDPVQHQLFANYLPFTIFDSFTMVLVPPQEKSSQQSQP